MAKYRLTYSLIGIAFLLVSCSHDDPGRIENSDKRSIEFKASLPEVVSRSTETSLSTLETFSVSSFAVGTSSSLAYFHDEPFTPNPVTGLFFSQAPACVWPNNHDIVHFMAFAPLCEEMRQAGGYSDTEFSLAPLTPGQEATIADYKIPGLKIPTDIAAQFDFVTAIGSGTLWDNEETPVSLQFKHQLSRIELKAWSESQTYGLEIAGVRLGGVANEGEFCFAPQSGADEASQHGSWNSVTKGSVEYIFRAGDRLVTFDKTAGTTVSRENALSIMGSRIQSGDKSYDNSAMLIPSDNPAWDYTANAGNGTAHADGMYISVLMRVTDLTPYAKPDPLVYPYSDNDEGMDVIYLAVDKTSGTVSGRVYANDGTYYTDEACTDLCSLSATEEIKAFGWAAFPVADTWEPGYVYTYTLNYTNGVGLRDPHDPQPGKPIISDKVLIDITVAEWLDGGNKDVQVPRR